MPRARRIADFHPELGLPEVRKLWQTEGLFSDHYLKARIRSNSWWPTDEETGRFGNSRKRFTKRRFCSSSEEIMRLCIRQELIDKILETLGFAWSDNLRLPETQQELEPDYLFYSPAKKRKRLFIEQGRHTTISRCNSITGSKKVRTSSFANKQNGSSDTRISKSAITLMRRKASRIGESSLMAIEWRLILP